MRSLALPAMALAAAAMAAAPAPQLFINGKPAPEPVQVNGEWHISLNALKAAGAQVVQDGRSIKIRFTPIEGGATQQDALEGGLNEWLMNGVFRMRVTKVQPIQGPGGREGFALTVEVGNITKNDLALAECGVKLEAHLFDSNGQRLDQGGLDLAEWNNGVRYQSMPRAGSFSKTVRYWFPDEAKLKGAAAKFLVEVDKEFGSFSRYPWNVKTPSMRFFLDR